MNQYPRRPLSGPKTVRLMIGVTILAWATQTLVAQWSRGQSPEQFVGGGMAGAATLQLRSEAVVYGADVTLRQVCQWPDADAPAFAPVADLVLTHLTDRAACELSVSDVKSTLRGAGFNLAAVNVVGPTRCAVRRADALPTPTPPPLLPLAASQRNLLPTTPKDEPAAPAESTTLRDLLTANLAARTNLAATRLQVDFEAGDEKLLALASPLFSFDIEPRRVWGLGRVSWTVTIKSATGEASKVNVEAVARAWEEQLVVNRPLAARQVVAADDVAPRRALVERLEPLAADARQVVGQQTSRALAAGAIVTTRDVEPVRLAKPGEFVTVTLAEGAVRVKTIVKALDGGFAGQTIRVRNETTREVFYATLTGPQAAVVGAPADPAGREALAAVE